MATLSLLVIVLLGLWIILCTLLQYGVIVVRPGRYRIARQGNHDLNLSIYILP